MTKGFEVIHRRAAEGAEKETITRFFALFAFFAVNLVLACNAGGRLAANDPPLADTPVVTVVIATLPPPTPTPPPPTATPSPTATPFGCLRPPDEYNRVTLAPEIEINQRTLAMLTWAQTLYGGSHDLVRAITQGSYTPGYESSFGTHDGGGAVDISVRNLNDFNDILTGDIPTILLALREAGFAAWLRELGELGENSPIHIHAVAVGDRDLSPAAMRQLSGAEGYFRGFNGLPKAPPIPDRNGPPILCPWMVEMGYSDLRGTTPTP